MSADQNGVIHSHESTIQPFPRSVGHRRTVRGALNHCIDRGREKLSAVQGDRLGALSGPQPPDLPQALSQ